MSCSPDKVVMDARAKWSRTRRRLSLPDHGTMARLNRASNVYKRRAICIGQLPAQPTFIHITTPLLPPHNSTAMCSCTTSIAVPTIQRTTAPSVPAAPTHAASTEKPALANYNGPQCCHCGWRGGGHDKSDALSSHNFAHYTLAEPSLSRIILL
ncbi:hypothetical protein C8J57DRAFT_1717032 [Mycena rebaudengoi]|nr:hypothetical protein C8J57DRAFT_1717032 [Mycena rebaudengoi]